MMRGSARNREFRNPCDADNGTRQYFTSAAIDAIMESDNIALVAERRAIHANHCVRG